MSGIRDNVIRVNMVDIGKLISELEEIHCGNMSAVERQFGLSRQRLEYLRRNGKKIVEVIEFIRKGQEFVKKHRAKKTG